MINKDLSFEEFKEKIKTGIYTNQGNCALHLFFLCCKANGSYKLYMNFVVHDSIRFGTLRKNLETSLILC